jgi:hypothetical protein
VVKLKGKPWVIVLEMTNGDGPWQFDAEKTKLHDPQVGLQPIEQLINNIVDGKSKWLMIEGTASDEDDEQENEPWKGQDVLRKRAVSLINVQNIASISIVFNEPQNSELGE